MIENIFFVLLCVTFIILSFSIFKGPTLWDRILAANLCLTVTAMAIILYAIVTVKPYYIDVALVFVLVGFVGTQFYSTFISRFGRL